MSHCCRTKSDKTILDEPVCVEEIIIAEEIGEDGTINKTVLESSIDRLVRFYLIIK